MQIALLRMRTVGAREGVHAFAVKREAERGAQAPPNPRCPRNGTSDEAGPFEVRLQSWCTCHWKLALPLGVLVILATVIASSSVAASKAKVVKVAIMTDETGWHTPSVRRVVMRGIGVAFAPDDYGRWDPPPLAAVGAQIADWCNFKIPAPKPERAVASLEAKPATAAKPPRDLVGSLRQMRPARRR